MRFAKQRKEYISQIVVGPLGKQLQQSWEHSPTGFRCYLVIVSAFGLGKASVLLRVHCEILIKGC